MTSPQLLSRSSSDSCSILLSSFSPSDSAHIDPLADLSPPPSATLNAPNVAIFEQEPAIADLPASSFLNSHQASTSLDVLPPDLIATIAASADQIIDVSTASGSNMCALGVSNSDVGSSHCDEGMACSNMGASQELSILQEQKLSTPTMHPNLVSTLKSIICPSAASPPQQDLNAHAHVQEHILGMPSKPAFGSTPASVNLGFPQLQTLFARPATPPVSMEEKTSIQPRIQHKHAAIVPVHLIQNRRPYRCSYGGCNKTFKNPQTLKMHHKTHCSSHGATDNDACSRGRLTHSLATFPQSCKAGQNKKIPSRCPICKRAFVGLYELRRHFGRKHSEGEKAHACSKCGKRFYVEVDLRDHQKLCGEPLMCKCGMKFAFKCNLVAHKKTHPMCQEEQEQQKYRQCQEMQSQINFPQVPGESSAALPSQLHTKAFFLPNQGESTHTALPQVHAVVNCNASRLYTLTPQINPLGSYIHRPIVKSENTWLASAILGASRAL